jgi:hypothetical protein
LINNKIRQIEEESNKNDARKLFKEYFCDLQTISSGTEKLISENVILSNSEEAPPPPHAPIIK